MEKPAEIALVFESQVFNNADIMKGVAAFAQQHCDWNFYLDDQAMAIADPSSLFKKNIDGLICRHLDLKLMQECVERKIPCVALDHTSPSIPEVPVVTVDDHAMGQVGAEYFLGLGYRNFGFCGYGANWSQARQIGFSETVAAAGFETSIQVGDSIPRTTPDWHQRETAAMMNWVESLSKPVAIMACHDLRGLILAGAIRDTGYLIPEDIAVLGAGNDTFRANLCQPPLSSVSINTKRWGLAVAECLHRQLEGKPVERLTLVEPLEVVVRRSTDAMAIEDKTILMAMKIIEEEVRNELAVDDLAKRVGISRSLLERRFRKFLRKSPQESIRAAKIAEAKFLLIETDHSLAEIAEILHFSHPEYLSVMFKRLAGETASAFRARHRTSP